MVKEGIPCPFINSGSQGARDGLGATTQDFLLCRLGFIADSQLFCIAIVGACKGRSDTLTTRVSSEITLR